MARVIERTEIAAHADFKSVIRCNEYNEDQGFHAGQNEVQDNQSYPNKVAIRSGILPVICEYN
jgi:hypothetical protein